jgi:hypothetical protein
LIFNGGELIVNLGAIEQRFWSKVYKTDTCWLWLASKNKPGYGYFNTTSKKCVRAHRFAWELSHHKKIPEGVCVLHHCDNPPCVNPAHLYLGTQAVNMADMIRRGRSAAGRPNCRTRGEHSGMAKLNEEQVRAIRIAYAAGKISQGTLARRYGVDQTLVSLVVKRKCWAHVA